MSFAEDLLAETNAPKPFEDVQVLLNGHIHTIRFTQVDGDVWGEAVDLSPVRIGVPLDLRYGYNVRSVVGLIAPVSGQLVDGDELADISEEQWRSILKRNGATTNAITSAIFGLNEHAPAEAVEAAKKALAAGSAKN